MLATDFNNGRPVRWLPGFNNGSQATYMETKYPGSNPEQNAWKPSVLATKQHTWYTSSLANSSSIHGKPVSCLPSCKNTNGKPACWLPLLLCLLLVAKPVSPGCKDGTRHWSASALASSQHGMPECWAPTMVNKLACYHNIQS